MDYSYKEDFKYLHKNPYHHKLQNYSDFVLRDHEGENYQGRWKKDFFKNYNPLILEIGCGYGHFLKDYALLNPHENIIGMDYRFKRSFELAKRLSTIESNNFGLLRAKGERIQFLFEKKELDKIFYFFADPWPKTRHKKKRLFNSLFLDHAHSILADDGKIFIKTDHDDLALHFKKVIDAHPLFDLVFETKNLYTEYPEHYLAQFQTKFEKIFLEKKIPIKAFVLQKKEN